MVCPHCRFRTVAEKSYAGMRGPCRNCGRTILVPKPSWGCGGWITIAVVLFLIIAMSVIFVLIVEQASRL